MSTNDRQSRGATPDRDTQSRGIGGKTVVTGSRRTRVKPVAFPARQIVPAISSAARSGVKKTIRRHCALQGTRENPFLEPDDGNQEA